MHRFAPLLILLGSLTWAVSFAAAAAPPTPAGGDAATVATTDWPWWRGPLRNGTAAADQTPPLQWSETENVIWKTSVPGRGHSSPTVVGERLFLTTADPEQQIQSVLCYDRASGSLRWKTDLHQGGFPEKMHAKSSMASSSVACDGQRVFVNFLNDGAVYTTALTLDGQQVWQTKISDYIIHQGYGSSPAIYQSLVIVSADNKGGGAVAALDRSSGEVVWRRERPESPNYPSPIIVHAAGRDQVILTGCDLVTSLNPLTGETLWEVEGATRECVTSTVTDGERIFTTGGYPRNHMSAVQADGSGKLAWENSTRIYVPSLLFRDGYLYGIQDAGIAACWKSDTGEEVWRARLGGTFTASPVLVGDHIFATSEEGQTTIFKASPERFERVGNNQLGQLVFPTPTICGNRIYMRVADLVNDQWQETLYCLGQEG